MWKTILEKKPIVTVRVFAIIISIIGLLWFNGVAWLGIIIANSVLLWQDFQNDGMKIR